MVFDSPLYNDKPNDKLKLEFNPNSTGKGEAEVKKKLKGRQKTTLEDFSAPWS